MPKVPQDKPVTKKKRNGNRRQTFSPGKIVVGRRGSLIDCVVRDASETGAMLNVQSAISVPDQFELGLGGRVRRCTVVWRKVTSIGVRFDN